MGDTTRTTAMGMGQMSDEELIARLRSLDTWAETADVPDLAADRIKQLVAKYDEAVECNEEFFVYNQILKERVARLEGAGSERPDASAHIVEYTNYRGETARRCIIPIRMWWGSTEWHPEEQWMLTAWDLDKNASRDFAWQDMRPVQNPGTSATIRAIPAADARAEALKEAAAIAQGYHDRAIAWAKTVRGLEQHIGETDSSRIASAILALIPEKQP